MTKSRVFCNLLAFKGEKCKKTFVFDNVKTILQRVLHQVFQ